MFGYICKHVYLANFWVKYSQIYFFLIIYYRVDALNHEISVVNDEYETDLGKEAFKLEGLLKQLSDPTHPFSRFSVGNNQTLTENGDFNIVEEL